MGKPWTLSPDKNKNWKKKKYVENRPIKWSRFDYEPIKTTQEENPSSWNKEPIKTPENEIRPIKSPQFDQQPIKTPKNSDNQSMASSEKMTEGIKFLCPECARFVFNLERHLEKKHDYNKQKIELVLLNVLKYKKIKYVCPECNAEVSDLESHLKAGHRHTTKKLKWENESLRSQKWFASKDFEIERSYEKTSPSPKTNFESSKFEGAFEQSMQLRFHGFKNDKNRKFGESKFVSIDHFNRKSRIESVDKSTSKRKSPVIPSLSNYGDTKYERIELCQKDHQGIHTPLPCEKCDNKWLCRLDTHLKNHHPHMNVFDQKMLIKEMLQKHWQGKRTAAKDFNLGEFLSGKRRFSKNEQFEKTSNKFSSKDSNRPTSPFTTYSRSSKDSSRPVSPDHTHSSSRSLSPDITLSKNFKDSTKISTISSGFLKISPVRSTSVTDISPNRPSNKNRFSRRQRSLSPELSSSSEMDTLKKRTHHERTPKRRMKHRSISPIMNPQNRKQSTLKIDDEFQSPSKIR
eukprot:TCONS_00028029-protein